MLTNHSAMASNATTRKVFIIWATVVTEMFNGSSSIFSATEAPGNLSSTSPATLGPADSFTTSAIATETSTIISTEVGDGFNSSASSKESTAEIPDNHLINNTLLLVNSSHLDSSNSTNATEPFVGGPVVWTGRKAGFFLLGLIITIETVCGNLLVILSVALEKKLQTPFNYYLVNLAVADLNVGLSVMPIFIIYNLYEYFPFSFATCSYWVWSDWTMTFESVCTLAAIGIDRLWSVTWSLHYRNHNSSKKSLVIIACTWLYVAVLWQPAYIIDRVDNPDTPGTCGFDPAENKKDDIYVGVLLYYFPLTVMVTCYARIFYVMRRRLKQIAQSKKVEASGVSTMTDAAHPGKQAPVPVKANIDNEMARARREKKAFYTLGHIVIAFLICWIPFYVYFLINPYHPDLLPAWYEDFAYWMAYLNSAVNPMVYGIGNDDFRRSFKKILTFKHCRK